MAVNVGQIAEYKKRHNPIWRELENELLNHGVIQYSIFFDETDNTLFAVADVEDIKRWEALSRSGICKKWWAYMKDIMPSNLDNSPTVKTLDEVFFLQRRS